VVASALSNRPLFSERAQRYSREHNARRFPSAHCSDIISGPEPSPGSFGALTDEHAIREAAFAIVD
jgi:hypothetical protein